MLPPELPEAVPKSKSAPAFGIARFRLSSGKPHTPQRSVSVKDGVLENGSVRARIDATSGNIVELALHGSHDDLVDGSRGEAVNEYLFLEGKDLSKIQRTGPVRILVEERGPLVASVRVDSTAR